MTEITKIPLVDLQLQHAAIEDEVREGFDRVLASGTYILGPEVVAFEAEFGAYCGVGHVAGVGNGTDALELALRAGRIGPGDDVIVPVNTYVATAEAVLRSGATLRLVDCDENYLIDAEATSAALGPRVRAIIGVHLYGQAAPMETLRALAGENVLLVEDAAQAQGARRHGSRAGSLGDIAGTSFYPGKNLGAYGDAGAVMTGSSDLAERVRMMRNHGGVRRYEHNLIGVNSRLDGLQAVVLRAKLARLDGWNQWRRDAAAVYDELVAALPEVVAPRVVAGNEHVFHLYVVRVPNRDAVVSRLNAVGIGASVHYPAPIHRLPAFQFLGQGDGEFPVAEKLAGQIMSLPIFPGITRGQQELIVDELRRALEA
ncbi:DegT/DnrJ/EryC1/StrS family aminotransferase [Cryobacterium sp. AP23]